MAWLLNSFNPESIIVGLGNPGREYARTRHNVGFRVLDALAKERQVRFDRRKFKGRIARTEIAGIPVLLLKPYTFMNNSGKAVARAVAHYQCPVHQLLVVADDLDLPLGTIRLRGQGGAAGHKGLRSIISELGTNSFPRLRVGIDRQHSKGDMADYVLSPFTEEEETVVERVVPEAVRALETFIQYGLELSMSKFNRSFV